MKFGAYDEAIDLMDLKPGGDFDRSPLDARCLLAYAQNVIACIEPASDEAQALVGWMARNRQQLGLAETLFTDADVDRGEKRRNTKPIPKTRWRAFRMALAERLGQTVEPANTALSLEPGFTAVTVTSVNVVEIIDGLR
jgi:hypothetical protein